MTQRRKVLVAGAGGIGRAVGLLLRELGEEAVDLVLADAHRETAEEAAGWIAAGSGAGGEVSALAMPREGSDRRLETALEGADLLLDCLPGSQAPRLARLARDHDLHYANLTEHVAETDEVLRIADGAGSGFLLQTGLAPGVINVLAHGLLQRFCARHGVERVGRVGLRTGALSENAGPPHHYGITWSSIGVATEYLMPCRVLRGGAVTSRPPLSEVETVRLGGVDYEEALTSGGVADLAEALAGRVDHLDYKTLRHPGHYAWVEEILEEMPAGEAQPDALARRMTAEVPHVDDDRVVLYAFVEGEVPAGGRRRSEASCTIRPLQIGACRLRSIQAATAAGLAESARLLLAGRYRGVVQQSQIDPAEFLSGPYVGRVYGGNLLRQGG